MPIDAASILQTFAVLKPDLGVDRVPAGPELYEALDRDYDSFKGHSLVAVHDFSAAWSGWERHPAGDEIVMLLSGKTTMAIKTDKGVARVLLSEPGAYVVVPRGAWHRAEPDLPSRLLFVTPGEGTEHSTALNEAF